MKRWQYATALTLAWGCLALGGSVLVLARMNTRVQRRLQARQIQIDNGLYSQRGRQITEQVLQEMIDATARSPRIRSLLVKYGYNDSPSSSDKRLKDPQPAGTTTRRTGHSSE